MHSLTRSAVAPVVVLAVLLALAAPGSHLAWAQAGSAKSNPAQTGVKPKSAPPPEARVDINHATLAELLKVPGMTPSWAGRIVRFRPYRSKADLVEKGVLPSDVYDRIKDQVIAHHGEP
ncbi:MAG TPA: helix-hairpin-helix domain-containing protein [Terracidiphilus sp.]